MKNVLLIGFAAFAFALAPALSASAMPVSAASKVVSVSDDSLVQVKGGRGHGRGHMGRGNRGRHLGWSHRRGRR